MPWIDHVTDYARSRGRRIFPAEGGVGIEFGDGYDVFWLLPDEFASTFPPPPDASAVPAALREFERVEGLRTRVLHVLRLFLAEKGVAVDRRPGGAWDLQGHSSIYLGPYLTLRARQSDDVFALVQDCARQAFHRPPSRKRIERYLHTPGSPAVEPAAPPETSSDVGIAQAVALLGLYEVIHQPAELGSTECLRQKLNSPGRIGQTLLRLAERLPSARASVELADGARLCVPYSDGLDQMECDPRSRELAKLVSDDGPQSAGDSLADDYERLDARRSQVLLAIRGAAAARGWGLLEQRGLMAPLTRWHLGKTTREVTLSVGRDLTALLRDTPPEGTLRSLLVAHPMFRDECLAVLTAGKVHAVALPGVELPPQPPDCQPPLRDLDATAVRELDAFADRILCEFQTSRDVLWQFSRPHFFDSARDTWLSPADRTRIAERYLGPTGAGAAVVRLLFEVGDPRADALARQYLDEATFEYDFGADETRLLWQYRHDYPELARRVFSPDVGDPFPWAQVRAEAGDPAAQHYLMAESFRPDDYHTWPPGVPDAVIRAAVPEVVRARLHDTLRRRARANWKWSPPETDELKAAYVLELPDVAEELENNPYLLRGLLLAEDRDPGQFDDPGLLLGDDLLYVWSHLNPTPFLARLIATAIARDPAGEGERFYRRQSRSLTGTEGRVAELTPAPYRQLRRALDLPMAVAWKRYRQRGLE